MYEMANGLIEHIVSYLYQRLNVSDEMVAC